jgi:hypothetical protein
METKTGLPRYKITIECTREIETLTNRQWVEGGPDGQNERSVSNGKVYGYTPQIAQTMNLTTTVFEMSIHRPLDVHKIAAAVLEATKESI